MDPYLEQHWLDVHGTFIAMARSSLNRVLPPDLIARTEERVSVEGADWDSRHSMRPDVRVFEPGGAGQSFGGVALEAPYRLVVDLDPVVDRFIKIIRPDDERIVTVIELVSPWNKREPGLSDYRQKRQDLIEGGVHVVEIDLVRRGDWRALLRPHVCPVEADSPYRVVTRLGGDPNEAYLYPLHFSKPLGQVMIPLRPDDKPAQLNLQEVIDGVYADGRYGKTLDYSRPCDPPLTGADADSAAQYLKADR